MSEPSKSIRFMTLTIALVAAVAAAVTLAVVVETRDRADTAAKRSAHLEAKVHRHAVEDQLRAQKVCTERHPEFCKALFDRLIRNVDDRRWKRLACIALRELDGADIRATYRRSRCARLGPPDDAAGRPPPPAGRR